jgi:hypothetical protein
MAWRAYITVAGITIEQSAQAEEKRAEARTGHTGSLEHGELKLQAERRHVSLPNHPATRLRGLYKDFFD